MTKEREKLLGGSPRQQPPQGWRPDLITVRVNQPPPPGPGIDWWLRRIMGR
jgi:hypothetical protein